MNYAIIGAGIGGLTTALALQRKGIAYQVYERFPKLSPVGAGIWLSPNALQVLEHLELLEEVKQQGNSIDRITIGKPDLSPISDIPQNLIKQRFGYSAIAIHRAKLQKLLLDKIPKEKVHLGKAFESFSDEGAQLSLNFSDGSGARTDFLIGADGIKSRVRNQLFPDSQIRYSGQTCWRGVADIELDSAFDNRVYELWGNQVRFGFSRISKAKYYWFAVALDAPNAKDDQAAVQQKLLSMFRGFDSTVIALLKATPTDKIIRGDLNDLKPMKKWYEAKVCLIGDAGHATTPNMGQGGAQAIMDAYYLSHFIQNASAPDAFRMFQDKREKKVNAIVNQSWMTGKVAHWKYGRGLRNLIMASVPKGMMNKKVIEMYEIEKFETVS